MSCLWWLVKLEEGLLCTKSIFELLPYPVKTKAEKELETAPMREVRIKSAPKLPQGRSLNNRC